MQVGDKVVCIDDTAGLISNQKLLIKGKIYVIDHIIEGRDGYIHYVFGIDGWRSKRFKPLQDIGMSTDASKRLAALFEERDGCPEFNPKERGYLPEEKVFDTEEDF